MISRRREAPNFGFMCGTMDHEYFESGHRAHSRPGSLLSPAFTWRGPGWWDGARPVPWNHRPHPSRHPKRFVPRRWEARTEALSCRPASLPMIGPWWELPSGVYGRIAQSFHRQACEFSLCSRRRQLHGEASPVGLGTVAHRGSRAAPRPHIPPSFRTC